MSNHFSFFGVLLAISLSFSAMALERVDPMRPDDQAETTKNGIGTDSKAVTKAPPPVDWWLQSIQIGERERSATINGRLLKIGDKIGSARLIAIEHDQVKLRRGGKQIKLMFLPRTIKK